MRKVVYNIINIHRPERKIYHGLTNERLGNASYFLIHFDTDPLPTGYISQDSRLPACHHVFVYDDAGPPEHLSNGRQPRK